MALPRQFRRLRISLIGFGDVAKRTLAQRLDNRPSSHGPRFIAVSRSGNANLSPSLQQAIRKNRSLLLPWDIDARRVPGRIARLTHATIVYVPTADGQGSSLNRDSRARRLAVAFRQNGKSVPLVYLSTTGVYGNHQDAVVDETSACRATQARALRRLDAEHQLRPIGAHVLRVPGIYGHDRLPIARIKAGQPALRQQDDVYTNHIHADDLARIAWIALFRGQPARVTNAVDQTEMKMAEYFDAVADAAHLPRPPRVSRADMESLARTGVIHPMTMGFLNDSRRVRSARLGPELGIRLRFPTVADTLGSLG